MKSAHGAAPCVQQQHRIQSCVWLRNAGGAGAAPGGAAAGAIPIPTPGSTATGTAATAPTTGMPGV
jgi:hypothetical protein